MVSGGQPQVRRGQGVTLRAVSGHRDGTLTDCPGDTIYAQLPAIAEEAYASGLPKIFAPQAGALTSYPVALRGRPVGFARLDGARARRGRDDDREQVRTGTSVAWTWDGRSAAGAPVAPGVAASWSIEAQDGAGNRALPATGGLLGTATPIEQGAGNPVTVEPSSISPDDDGQADAATITFSLLTPSSVTVTVQDSLGTTLSTVLPPTAAPQAPSASAGAGRPSTRG